MLSSAVFVSYLIWVVYSKPREAPLTQSGPQCIDWGVYEEMVVSVYEGEAGRIPCPLFSHPKLYNYAHMQSSGHTLLWYRLTHSHTLAHEPEEPVNLSLQTLIKHRDALWIQNASVLDQGLYICMLRNVTSCAKIGVWLEVFSRNEVCDYTLHHNISVPLQSNQTLHCPNLQYLHSSTYNVTWYYNCKQEDLTNYQREVRGDELVIYKMYTWNEGQYTCVVFYHNNGQTYHYSANINLRAVSSGQPRKPIILSPQSNVPYIVTVGKVAKFVCQVLLPYMKDEEQQVWWTVNNKTLEELSEPRYSSPIFRQLFYYYGDRNVERLLLLSPVKSEDLQKEFRCSAHNSRGMDSQVVMIKEEVYVPSVELGCGLGVTLALVLLLFVLYRVFWLEVHLLYRSWFGTDERDTDNKEYDVYISYARNTEEEEFVMTTLRRVLETEFGYTVCIFDRDSLPGGTVTEETLQFITRSRRLLVILSACSAFRDGQALLEVRAGMSSMLRGDSLKLVLIQFKPVQKPSIKRTQDTHRCVQQLKRARMALTLVRWEGERSVSLSSHFWKKLRLQLPVRTHTPTTTNTDTIPLTNKSHTPTPPLTRKPSHPQSSFTKNPHTYTHVSEYNTQTLAVSFRDRTETHRCNTTLSTTTYTFDTTQKC